MTDFGPTNNEMTSTPNDATDPAVVGSADQPPAESTTPAATALPSNPPTAVSVARKRPAVKKAPVRKPKAAATKKAAAKKEASVKVGVEAVAPKETTSAKKAASKKAVAKKTRPLKAVVAPPQVTRRAAPRTGLTTSFQATSSESVRDAAKTKGKLVRDSFTMPQQDFGLIAILKDRALGFKRPAKKSELLRAGLYALQQLTDAQLRGALDSLVPLKAGRPKK
jgi:hypothetical protein